MSKRLHWANNEEAGFLLGMQFLFGCYRFFGHRLFKALLFPVLIYFLVFRRSARTASLEYTRRLDECFPELGLSPGWRLSYNHFDQFVSSMVDKLDFWRGKHGRQQVVFEGREEFIRQLKTGSGAILLGSHLGNLDACQALAEYNPDLELTILVHTKNAEKFNRLSAQFSRHRQAEFVQISDINPAVAITLSDRIRQGGVIVILGDRTPPTHQSRTVAVEFLGTPASFPQGPLIVASLLKCPVYTVFCLKEEFFHRVYIEPLAEQILLPRSDRERALYAYIQTYAHRLEHYCRIAPLQWYNFFPFWA